MRKFLLAGVIALAPFAAFAAGPQGAQIAGNVALTTSGSVAGVQSQQGTLSSAVVQGNGAVITGTVAGNYTSIDTSGSAKAGLGYAKTDAKTTQVNIGGTISGGVATQGRHGTADGTTSGNQSSQTVGGSAAVAADLGGFAKVQQPKHPTPTNR
jgi:hypothetical protein